MTQLKSISQNHLGLRCSCTHAAQVSVEMLIGKLGGDITVHDAIKKFCCHRCGAKQITDFRIIFIGASAEAMRGANQTRPEPLLLYELKPTITAY